MSVILSASEGPHADRLITQNYLGGSFALLWGPSVAAATSG